jgi:hypothetical protein
VKRLRNGAMNCWTCEHWEKSEKTIGVFLGECHRNPPQVVQCDLRSRFPVTAETDWCSQWQEDAYSRSKNEYQNARANLERFSPEFAPNPREREK